MLLEDAGLHAALGALAESHHMGSTLKPWAQTGIGPRRRGSAGSRQSSYVARKGDGSRRESAHGLTLTVIEALGSR